MSLGIRSEDEANKMRPTKRKREWQIMQEMMVATVRKSCDRNLLEPRISKAIGTSSLIKVRSHSLKNEPKKTYKFTSRLIINGKLYKVTICNTPSCTCSDDKKNGAGVFCRHILWHWFVCQKLKQAILFQINEFSVTIRINMVAFAPKKYLKNPDKTKINLDAGLLT